MKFRILFLLTIPLLLTGCASIVDGGPKAVHINSKPEGAKVTIFNKAGQEVASETTPATVKLKRSVSFSQEEDYKVVFAMDGYYPHEAHVKTAINGWYWGNIVCGGIIGCCIDMGTGSCYTLSPSDLTWTMISSATPLTPEQLKKEEEEANSPKKFKPASTPKGKQ